VTVAEKAVLTRDANAQKDNKAVFMCNRSHFVPGFASAKG
jgi:hypothetical protein